MRRVRRGVLQLIFYKVKILVQYYVVVVQRAHCVLVSSKQKYVKSIYTLHCHRQVDMEVCEQVFSWLSRYGKMTQKKSRHIFFLLYICELHNREIEKLQRVNFL